MRLFQKFLKNGGDVDARNKKTLWSLLHTAGHAGQDHAVKFLIAAGAKIDTHVEGNYNSLLLCCSCGSDTMSCPTAVPKDVENPGLVECGHLKVGQTTCSINGLPW